MKLTKKLFDKIATRAQYLAIQMIYQANHRKDKEKGDPKVGGHVSASASALHVLGAIHLQMKTGFDFIANKPHASPADHAYNYLLDNFLQSDLERFSVEDKNQAMMGLRAFSQKGEPVFQSYHSAFDPDRHNFFPSGTVGIPPVNAGYMALAYRYAREHGYEVPDAHFWCVMGDSEFREGSLLEAAPDFAEREIGNVTWVIDYNRQSLDGHRITNKEIMNGTDAHRIERTMVANGWEVIQVQHGRVRQKLFNSKDGDKFKNFIENELEDYELQALLLLNDPDAIYQELNDKHPHLKTFLKTTNAKALFEALFDFGGHDFDEIVAALAASKANPRKPTAIVLHTIKGWGLEMAAMTSNHSAITSKAETEKLQAAQGLAADQLFAGFDENSEEGKFLRARGDQIYQEIKQQEELRQRNLNTYKETVDSVGGIPDSLNINLKMASYPHTQWMLGQLTAKLTRIANTPLDESKLVKGQKALSSEEMRWRLASEMLLSMAPDVGTSTNLNPAMDGHIFGAVDVEEYEENMGVRDAKQPDLIPGEEESDRFIRFEIAECNAMSALGSFGQVREVLGIPLLPLMTVYDFFVKRAHDQYFYNLYWKSSFLLGGTPAGVTLSPEGAQHGWKSDFQIPNQITWEPFFCQELDWIFCDSVKRHYEHDNAGRSGVLIRCVTRGIEQKDFLKYLKRQSRFKINPDSASICPNEFPMPGAVNEDQLANISDEEIFSHTRNDVLAGGYYLIDYRDYAGYEPGDNVVHIFALGSLTTEAIKASNELLTKGIYANVIVVTSTDLLLGNQAYENHYQHLSEGLDVNANLYLQGIDNGSTHIGDLLAVSGRRVPIVSVHDGEPGLLDNIGSIIGVKHESLAVRKHSKCGRPKDVYEYHHIDSHSVVEAAGKVLSETALEKVELSKGLVQQIHGQAPQVTNWRELWPEIKN